MIKNIEGEQVKDEDPSIPSSPHENAASVSEELFVELIDEIRARIGQRVKLSVLEEDYGISVQMLRKLLKKYGILLKSIGAYLSEYAEEIEEMAAERRETKEIAAWLGCSEEVVHRFLQRHRIPSRTSLSHHLTEIKARLGWRVPLATIAEEMGVTLQAVWDMAKRNGIRSTTVQEYLERYADIIDVMLAIHVPTGDICAWLGVGEYALNNFVKDNPILHERQELERFLQEYLYLNDIFRMRAEGKPQSQIAAAAHVSQSKISSLLLQTTYPFHEWRAMFPPKPQQYLLDHEEELIAEYKECLNLHSVAERHGINPPALRTFFAERGIVELGGIFQRLDENREQVFNMVHAKVPRQSICAEFGVSTSTLTIWLRVCGKYERKRITVEPRSLGR